MALRYLAETAAARGRLTDAAVLLGASRRNMPAWGLDPAIYGRLETQCRDGLGHDQFLRLVSQGEQMTHGASSTLSRPGDRLTPGWRRHSTRAPDQARGRVAHVLRRRGHRASPDPDEDPVR